MEKLRECPWCGKTDDLKIETTGPTFKIRCKDIECGYEFVSLSEKQAIWNWNNRTQPKHETVEQWEERTGDTYPDDAPVWTYFKPLLSTHPKGYWELETWLECKGWEWDNIKPTIVANHHGKPDSVGER